MPSLRAAVLVDFKTGLTEALKLLLFIQAGQVQGHGDWDLSQGLLRHRIWEITGQLVQRQEHLQK
jgi:hypothetical protein